MFFGVVTITFGPFLRKWLLEDEMEWDPKYTGTAIFCLITAFVAAMQGFQGFIPPEGTWVDVIIEGYVYGLALSAIVNEAIKWPNSVRKVRALAMKGKKIE